MCVRVRVHEMYTNCYKIVGKTDSSEDLLLKIEWKKSDERVGARLITYTRKFQSSHAHKPACQPYS